MAVISVQARVALGADVRHNWKWILQPMQTSTLLRDQLTLPRTWSVSEVEFSATQLDRVRLIHGSRYHGVRR